MNFPGLIVFSKKDDKYYVLKRSTMDVASISYDLICKTDLIT